MNDARQGDVTFRKYDDPADVSQTTSDGPPLEQRWRILELREALMSILDFEASDAADTAKAMRIIAANAIGFDNNIGFGGPRRDAPLTPTGDRLTAELAEAKSQATVQAGRMEEALRLINTVPMLAYSNRDRAWFNERRVFLAGKTPEKPVAANHLAIGALTCIANWARDDRLSADERLSIIANHPFVRLAASPPPDDKD